MLVLNNKNINLNGQSVISDNVVASMNVNYSGDVLYTNFNIEDIEAYELNKATVLTDWEDFLDSAVDLTK